MIHNKRTRNSNKENNSHLSNVFKGVNFQGNNLKKKSKKMGLGIYGKKSSNTARYYKGAHGKIVKL